MDPRATTLLAALDIGPHRIEDLLDDAPSALVTAARELRQRMPVLRHGRERRLRAPAGTQAWRRTLFGEGHDVWDVVVVVNETQRPIDTGLVGSRLLSTAPGAPERFTGVLLPLEAAVISDETS